MLTIQHRLALVSAATIALLAACSQGGPDKAEDQEAPPVQPAPPAPDPGALDVLSPTPPAPAAVVQAAAPGVWTSNAITIRGETANLRVTDEQRRWISVGMTVTIENASTSPISVAIAEDGWPRLQLDNGQNMEPGNQDISVLRRCSKSLIECRQGQRDRFIEIEGGKSLSVTMTFRGVYPEGGREDTQTVDSGTATMRLHVLEGDGLNRTLDVSLKDTPIQNRIN